MSAVAGKSPSTRWVVFSFPTLQLSALRAHEIICPSVSLAAELRLRAEESLHASEDQNSVLARGIAGYGNRASRFDHPLYPAKHRPAARLIYFRRVRLALRSDTTSRNSSHGMCRRNGDVNRKHVRCRHGDFTSVHSGHAGAELDFLFRSLSPHFPQARTGQRG